MLSTGNLTLDIVLIAVGCFTINYFFRQSRSIPKGLRLPPGPTPLPIIGNMLDAPTKREWETAALWKEKYGNIVYLNVLGTGIVYVNGIEEAKKIFDERSSVYSDRHEIHMLTLCGWDFNFGFMRYGDRWRRHRRSFHQSFNEKASTIFLQIQEKHARNMAKRMADDPKAFVEHINQAASASIVEVVYGIKIKPEGDQYITNARNAVEAIIASVVPGTFLVDLFPILKYVPEWVPGAGFKRKAREWRSWTDLMSSAPYKVVKKGLEDGTAQPSVMANSLSKLTQLDNVPEDEEEVIRDTCGVSYSAGFGTIVGTTHTFVLAMVLHPDAQRKAQQELDTVLGNRLPTVDDKASLPYITALANEVQRWRPVAPLGIPHALSKDDVFGQYFLPKGTVIIGNAWSVLREECYGPRPEEFEPDRFFKPGVPIPTAQYGFGRRICPGRHFADNAVWILMATMLKLFDFSHAKDAQGNNIKIDPAAYTSGLVCEPEPFECSITPRSEAARSLIPQEIED